MAKGEFNFFCFYAYILTDILRHLPCCSLSFVDLCTIVFLINNKCDFFFYLENVLSRDWNVANMHFIIVRKDETSDFDERKKEGTSLLVYCWLVTLAENYYSIVIPHWVF